MVALSSIKSDQGQICLCSTFSKRAAIPKPTARSNSAPGVWSSAVGGSILNAIVSFGRLGSPDTYTKMTCMTYLSKLHLSAWSALLQSARGCKTGAPLFAPPLQRPFRCCQETFATSSVVI